MWLEIRGEVPGGRKDSEEEWKEAETEEERTRRRFIKKKAHMKMPQ